MSKLSFGFVVFAGCTGAPRYVGIDGAPAQDAAGATSDGARPDATRPDAADASMPADSGPASDAPRPCTWGAPTILLNVNSSLIDAMPDVSDDGLTLYFTRLISERDSDIYVATRLVNSQPFGTPERLTELDDVNVFEDAPNISKTGTEIFYRKSVLESPGSSIWTASRGSAAAKFTNAQSLGVDGYEPSITGDGLTLYYMAIEAPTVRKLTRPSIGAPWSAPADVMPSMGYGGLDISADGLKLVLSDGPARFLLPPVQVAERATTSAAFGALAPIPSLNVTGDTSTGKAASFNADATQIYMEMILPTGNGGPDIYVASCQ